MVMPTDALLQKATTQTSAWQKLIPQLWAARIERNLRKKAELQTTLVVNAELMVPNPGDTIYIPLLPDLGPIPALTEGVDMPINAMANASSVPLTPTEYGYVVEVSRKLIDRIKYDGGAEIADRLGYGALQTLEGAVAALYNATVPGTAFTPNAVYANNKLTGTITAGDIFNDALILQGVANLKVLNNHPFEDGYFRCFITPTQHMNLMQDTNTRQDLRSGNVTPLFSGEIGVLHQTRIVVSNWPVVATENSVPVKNALLVAPRWAACAWKRPVSIIVDPTLYDMGRRRRFGVTCDFDIELLHAERVQVLKSA